jgi:hypothetical protein
VASYFNLGTEHTPRWINLTNFPLISAKRTGTLGGSEVHLRGGTSKEEVVCGDVADRLIVQLGADPELKKISGV